MSKNLYKAARVMRDVNAVKRSPKAIVKRAARKSLWKLAARLIRTIVR